MVGIDRQDTLAATGLPHRALPVDLLGAIRAEPDASRWDHDERANELLCAGAARSSGRCLDLGRSGEAALPLPVPC